MANEKLIFEIGFDLDGAVQVAIKDGKKAITKIQNELGKTPIQLDVDTKSLRAELKKLNDEWNKLSASQRAGVEGTKLREQYRALTLEAKGYTSTLRSAVSAEDKATAAKQRAIAASDLQTNAYKTQSTYLARLVQRMVAYASVAQAMSFLRNIREVTAEFELQRVALGALIQDTQKAEMIFEQIKVAAVKSPYEVKDLVTYTKQLAAYGVKADDLMGTMNQLADISAGLGTDMDRIILAYGQIQAAGVLKGTELKQLTELGLPMVELLADYYSTLRNEVVTTSEVVDMISNKEIPFEAVQSILQDLTSEGGRFFDMQSKQAETLQGQWSNMKDTLSIMFDEIGRSEEVRALLNSMIDGVKWLAENWRLVWKGVKSVVLAYGSLKVATSLTKALAVTMDVLRYSETRAQIATKKYNVARIAANRTLLTQGRVASLTARQMQLVAFLEMRAATATNVLTRAFAKLGAVLMANPVTAIMALVGGIASYVIATKGAEAEIETFEDQQRKFAEGTMKSINAQVQSFKRLAQEVVYYEDGSEKQQSALRKLKDSFGDLLPEYQLTAEYLRKVSEEANGSADAFDRMANSVRATATVRLKEKLLEQREEELDKKLGEVYDQLTGGGFTIPVSTFADMQKQIEEGIYWEDVYRAWRKGMEKASGALTYGDYWRHRLSTGGIRFLSGIDGNGLTDGDEIWFTWKELLDAYHEGLIKWEDYERLLQQIIGAEGVKNINTLYDYLKFLGEYEEAVEGVIDDYDTLAGEFDKITEIVNRARKEQKYTPAIEADTPADQYKEHSLYTKEVVKRAYASVRGELFKENQDLARSMPNVFDEFLESYEGGKWNDIELPENIVYGIEELRKTFGYMDDEWRNFMATQVSFVNNNPIMAFNAQQISSFGTLYDAIDEVGKLYKETSDKLEMFRKLRSRTLDSEALAYYDQEIAKLDALGNQYLNFLTRYGWVDEERKKKNEEALKNAQSNLKNELSMVEKIYKEYGNLRKYMFDDEARSSIEKMFGNVSFDTLGIALSPDEMRVQLKKALAEAERLGDEKLALDIKYTLGKLDVDESKQKMERDMRKLSDELSRTKTAKEFFDRMLGMTGDKELSASLTVSIYGGEMGDDLGERLAKDMATKFQEQVQKYFGDIDISSAINKATGKIDPIKLEKLLTEENIKKMGEDNVIEVRKIINDLIKANADYATELFKSYEKFFDYEKRMTMVTQREEEERKKIRESMIPDDQKTQLEEASKKREQEQISAIEIEQLKDTADWEKTFEDLNNLGSLTVKNLISLLEDYIAKKKEAGEPIAESDMKTLMNELNQLRERNAQLDPFATIKASLKALTDATKEYNKAKKDGDEKGMADAQNKRAKALNNLETAVNAVASGFQNLSNLLTEFQELLGIEDDSAMGEVFNGAAKALGFVATALSTVIALTLLWNSTLWKNPLFAGVAIVSGVLGAIVGVFSAIANAKVSKANKEIEPLQDHLDNLEYSFDRLQKAQEKAFGSDYISNYQRQLENLEAQQEAYLKQAEAERSKGKKADKDKIKEYEEQARDTADAIKDMYGSLSEKFLGSDLTSAARDFATAWIDAYKEFSNTTDAMKEKFQDMIQNMIVESLIAKVMERALKPVFDMVDNMSDSDFYSNSFWSQLMTEMNKATENGVVGAERIMQMLEQIGVNIRDTGTGLTGISRDIATASEESILGLAAGINTQNFYISQVPTKLDTIIGLLRGGSAVVDSGVNVQDLITIQNQFLSHLPTIAQHTAETVTECKAIVVETRRTADALERVIKPDGTRTTYKMNVVTTYQG